MHTLKSVLQEAIKRYGMTPNPIRVPSGFDRTVVVIIAVLALALSVVALVATRRPSGPGPEAPAPSGGLPVDFSAAAADVMPSLVKIENLALSPHPKVAPFGMSGEVPRANEGTGFFIDKDGLLLTNFHVVDRAELLKVITPDRREYEATVVGGDELTDVALIRIEPDFDIRPVRFGDSDSLKVGQWVLAMGNPLGLEFFTAAGIVSGFGPPGQGYMGLYDFIQMDVNIKPGNSGGPLVDYNGNVVGVNTAYLGPGSGIGFAIPINRIRKIIPVLISEGRVRRGYMGLMAQPLTSGLAERLGLDSLDGALISGFETGSPAERAGLEEGDVVVSYNGMTVHTDREFYEMIHLSSLGSEAELDVIRDGEHIEITVTLGELRYRDVVQRQVIRQCGITLQEVDEELAPKLGLSGPGGLLVLKVVPGCPSYAAGLMFGDVILRVESRKVNTIADFFQAYSKVAHGKQALIQIMRRGRPQFLTLEQVGG